MARLRLFNNCVNCVHRETILGISGCTHKKGGHTILHIHKDKCINFRCEWCFRNKCICKRSDFY